MSEERAVLRSDRSRCWANSMQHRVNSRPERMGIQDPGAGPFVIGARLVDALHARQHFLERGQASELV